MDTKKNFCVRMKDSRDTEMLKATMTEFKYKKVGSVWKSYSTVVKPIVTTAQEERKTANALNKKPPGPVQHLTKINTAKNAGLQNKVMAVDQEPNSNESLPEAI